MLAIRLYFDVPRVRAFCDINKTSADIIIKMMMKSSVINDRKGSSVYSRSKAQSTTRKSKAYSLEGVSNSCTNLNSLKKNGHNNLANSVNTISRGPNIGIISKEEFDLIKKEAMILTSDEVKQRKEFDEKLRQQEFERAEIHRSRMKQLEIANNFHDVAPSEFDLEEQEKKKLTLKKAEEFYFESLDEVKHMNQIVSYAKAATVREKQLDELKMIRRNKEEVEKRKDLMMEIERLKQIEIDEEKQLLRRSKQVQGRKMIVDQINDREIVRLTEKEELGKEAQDILRKMKQNEIEDQQNVEKKKEFQEKLFEEIIESNKQQMRKKADKIQREKEDDEKIFQYLLEKDRKEQERNDEEKRRKEEKESEIKKLRDMQQREMNRQGDYDELRAKRAVEKAERDFREKEKNVAEKKQSMLREMLDYRKRQALDKQKLQEKQTKLDRDEFYRVINKQKELKEREIQDQQIKLTRATKNMAEINKQVLFKDELKKQLIRDKYEEGKKIKDSEKKIRLTLQKIKQQKLDLLNELNVPEKFQVELMNKKV